MPISMPSVAVFDFDHTLTTCDTLLPFLFFTHQRVEVVKRLIPLTPDFIRFCLNRDLRQNVKEKIITSFYQGVSYEKLQSLGRQYAGEKLDHFLRPDAMNRLAWHQSQNHRCVLVSASLDIYLKPWAKRYGFETVLSSSLQVTNANEITGVLKGVNCWGPEKKRRLIEYLGPPEFYDLYVYGDSRGDREILQIADHAYYRTFE